MPRDGSTAPAHGLFCLPNAASFDNTHLSEPLTAYAQGWRDPTNIEAVTQFFFPAVQVPRRFEFRKTDDSADFLIDSDDERAAGADFKRVEYKGEVVQEKTANRGLTVYVDPDEVSGMPNWQQVYTGRLLRRIMRSGLDKAVTALVAAAANTGKTWGSTADPDADGISLVESAGDAIGFNPNKIAFLGSAWSKRILSLRTQATAGAITGAALTTVDLVAAYWGAQRGINHTMRVQGAAGKAKSGGGNYVLAFHAEDGVGPEDPSSAKRFWSPCSNGAPYAVYVRPVGSKFWSITVECYDRYVITSTVGLKKYTIS